MHADDVAVGWSRSFQRLSAEPVDESVLLGVNTKKENIFVAAFEVGTSLADSGL